VKEESPKTQEIFEKPVTPKIVIDSHEGAEFYLLQLGEIMGFLTYTVDKNAMFQNKRLVEASVSVLQEVPQFAAEHIMTTVKENRRYVVR
jgi:hypothetical protein